MIFRPARETDLRAAWEVFVQNELVDSPQPPPVVDTPSYLRHVLESGSVYVAEEDGRVLAFAGAITRGNIRFLTDLFVWPDYQSGRLGRGLLYAVMPLDDGLVHCTLSSSDPRALALYIRSGMRPQWPCFGLRLEKTAYKGLSSSDIEVVEAEAGDPALVEWDAQVSGRERPADSLFWVREQRAMALWFRRHGQVVGYGYVRLGAGTLWHPDACAVGPIGVRLVEDAEACVLAAVNLALQHTEMLEIEVPGPHPCLATLLEAGSRIAYVDTFVSSAQTPFFDAQRYIPSGGDLC